MKINCLKWLQLFVKDSWGIMRKVKWTAFAAFAAYSYGMVFMAKTLLDDARLREALQAITMAERLEIGIAEIIIIAIGLALQYLLIWLVVCLGCMILRRFKCSDDEFNKEFFPNLFKYEKDCGVHNRKG